MVASTSRTGTASSRRRPPQGTSSTATGTLRRQNSGYRSQGFGRGIHRLDQDRVEMMTQRISKITNEISNFDDMGTELEKPNTGECIELRYYLTMDDDKYANQIQLMESILEYYDKFTRFASKCKEVYIQRINDSLSMKDLMNSIEQIKQIIERVSTLTNKVTPVSHNRSNIVPNITRRSYEWFFNKIIIKQTKIQFDKKKDQLISKEQKNIYNSLILQNSISNNDISSIKDKSLQIKLRVEQKKKKKQMFINEDKIQNEQIKYFKNTSNFRKNNRYVNQIFSPNFKNELEKKRKEVIKDFTSAYKSARIRFLRGYVSYIKQLIRTGEANKNYAKEYRNATKKMSSNYGSPFLRKYTREAAKSMSKTEQSYRKQIRKLVQVLKKKYKR